MPLHQNNQLLVKELEAISLLDGRFEQIKLVNFDSTNDVKRGCFSLVFRAIDRVSGNVVALKFFDLDPAWVYDQYRRNAFVREHEILQALVTKSRCLQLVAGINTYDLAVPMPDGSSFSVPCQYFATQWLEASIDDYFFNSNFSAVERLRLLLEIVLAVEALHRNEVFHRDLKADNLRAIREAARRLVVAIDLGTAARFSSGNIQQAYGHSVGAPAYAPVEAQVGLAGNRLLAPYSDIYAIGCLLYELFNPDYFYFRLLNVNPQYQLSLVAMGLQVSGISSAPEQVTAWQSALDKNAAGIAAIEIDGAGSTAPPAIAPMLNELLASLTHVDYRRRPKKLEWARIKIQSAIKVLENQDAYQAKLNRTRDLRIKRDEQLKIAFNRQQVNRAKRLGR